MEGGHRQAHYISGQNGDSIYNAALTAWLPHGAWGEQGGLVFATVDNVGGIVDPNAKRPLCFGRDHARFWMDPFSPIHLVKEVMTTALQPEMFTSWPVSDRVNDLSNNNDRDVIKPQENMAVPRPEMPRQAAWSDRRALALSRHSKVQENARNRKISKPQKIRRHPAATKGGRADARLQEKRPI